MTNDPELDGVPRTNRRQILQYAALLPVAGAGLLAIQRVAGQEYSNPAASPEASPAASPQTSPAAVVEVFMTQQLRFDPAELTVQIGDTVRWINASTMPHSVTCDPDQNPVNVTNPEYVVLPDGAEPWGSAILQPGEIFEHQFTTAGHYEYLCIPHVLSGMRAAIEVTA